MELKTAIELLEKHNQWRRGDDTIDMADPELLGMAIDLVLNQVKNYVAGEELKQKISVIVSNTTLSGNEKRDQLLDLYGLRNRQPNK